MRLRWACQNTGEGRGNVEDSQQVGSAQRRRYRGKKRMFCVRDQKQGEATSLFSPNVQIVISFNFPWDVPG